MLQYATHHTPTHNVYHRSGRILSLFTVVTSYLGNSNGITSVPNIQCCKDVAERFLHTCAD